MRPSFLLYQPDFYRSIFMELKTRATGRADAATLRYIRGDDRAFRWAFLWSYVANPVGFPVSKYDEIKRDFDRGNAVNWLYQNAKRDGAIINIRDTRTGVAKRLQ
jgi:hypothetical protein